jgi:pyruvate dehydrogenase complex dihydrolipoamide acetyltransferase long form
MGSELAIPKLGMTMKEAKIVKWVKAEGEWIRKGEIVLVIETEKITFEVEAPADGYLHILAQEGETLPVGTLVGLILEEREEYEEAVGAGEASGPSPTSKTHPSYVAEEELTPMRSEGQMQMQGRIKASPLARKIARAHGIDLQSIRGTGPYGRIVKADVMRAIEELRAVPRVPPEEAELREEEGPPEERIRATIPLEGMRREILTHMQRSLQETAQMTLTCEVDASELVRLRETLLRRYQQEGIHITYNDILVRMVAGALRQHPEINSSVEGDRIIQWEGIHIGVAMELEEGLIVPVVRNADRLSIVEIHSILQDLFERARKRRMLLDEIKGGTFTLTNLGHLGIDAFTPILNRPQSGILGVGRIVKRPVVVAGTEDRTEVRPCMTLSLTVDHRIIDGAPAARFLRKVASYIEDPFLLIG